MALLLCKKIAINLHKEIQAFIGMIISQKLPCLSGNPATFVQIGLLLLICFEMNHLRICKPITEKN